MIPAPHEAPGRPVIALLTDFGTRDPFVGVMKGAILRRCPGASIVDLTHAVPPQSVSEGAFWLDRCVPWLPSRTVFVAVVDPGVGTERRPLVVEARSMVFVGPDNGLLAPALDDAGRRVFEIDPSTSGLAVPSRTFHGRDVFAPVAAEIAAGRMAACDAGPPVADPVPSALARPEVHEDFVEGSVVTIDRFGNLITNIDERHVAVDGAGVSAGTLDLPISKTYGDVPSGGFLALVNSFGTIEVARRDGDASAALGLGRGARVVLRAKRVPRN